MVPARTNVSWLRKADCQSQRVSKWSQEIIQLPSEETGFLGLICEVTLFEITELLEVISVSESRL